MYFTKQMILSLIFETLKTNLWLLLIIVCKSSTITAVEKKLISTYLCAAKISL